MNKEAFLFLCAAFLLGLYILYNDYITASQPKKTTVIYQNSYYKHQTVESTDNSQ